MAGDEADALQGQEEIDQIISETLAQPENAPGDDDTGASSAQADAELPPGAVPMDLPALDPDVLNAVSAASQAIDLLRDVQLNVKIELGRSKMVVEDVLRLGEGSVVELDKLAGDPVDVFVNDRLVARGEVLVLNDNFCVRINDIVRPEPEEIQAN